MNFVKTLVKQLNIRHIDVLIYKLPKTELKKFDKDISPYYIKTEKGTERDTFSILNDKNQLVHKSLIFKKVHLLKLIGSEGHVIGGCVTHETYRGQSFYPLMLNKIGKQYFESGNFNLYIIVDKTNLSSIRGIEKAGFKRFKDVKTKRFGTFYFNTTII